MEKFTCISFDSYIKPQLRGMRKWLFWVVYLLIPTSNHNRGELLKQIESLYIFWFLHQTTTYRRKNTEEEGLYIFWFLHQTTTSWNIFKNVPQLYIFWFLHQTTTVRRRRLNPNSCISFDSYIKPQLTAFLSAYRDVVYLLIPTSNHNFNTFLYG